MDLAHADKHGLSRWFEFPLRFRFRSNSVWVLSFSEVVACRIVG